MKDILANLMSVLDEEHARAVIEYRRATVKKPLTAFAAKLLAKRFAEWGNPNEAAEIMIEKCWQGFQASWVKDRAVTLYERQQAPRAPMMADYTRDLLDRLDEANVH